MEVYEDVVEVVVDWKCNEVQGVIGFDFDSLYDGIEEVVLVKVFVCFEWMKKDKFVFEWEMFGLYVLDYLFVGFEVLLVKYVLILIYDFINFEDMQDGDQVMVVGLVMSVQYCVVKVSGNLYGMIMVEDFNGEVIVMFMGKMYIEFQYILQQDVIFVVCGWVLWCDDGFNLYVQLVFLFDVGLFDVVGLLLFVFVEQWVIECVMMELVEVLCCYNGDIEVLFCVYWGGMVKVFEVFMLVKVLVDLFGDFKLLFGFVCFG